MRGYVIIEVSGFSVERFMNLAVHKGVYIWDIVRDSDVATMKVSIKGFKLLKSCSKKTKCRIKIKNKQGVPFLAFRYRRRKILAFGVIFFIFILFFLSSFVWLLEVEGNDIITTAQITEFLNHNGFSVGSFKYSVNEKFLEKSLMQEYGDISWINIHITGTKATVRIREAIPKQPFVDKSVPCDIVAAKDGLITSISTMSGTPRAKQGDVVQKGDLLVSGELLVGTEDTGFSSKYVHAQSEVRAKMYYEVTVSVPYEYTVKNYTGKTLKEHSMAFFDNKIDFLKRNKIYENYDKITNRTQLNFGEDYPLPIIIITDEYKEYIPEKRLRTADYAKEIAQAMITGRIISEFDFDADIIDKAVTYTENEDYLEVKAVITTIERIDEKREITQERATPFELENNEEQ